METRSAAGSSLPLMNSALMNLDLTIYLFAWRSIAVWTTREKHCDYPKDATLPKLLSHLPFVCLIHADLWSDPCHFEVSRYAFLADAITA